MESTFVKNERIFSWEAAKDATETEVAKYVKVLEITLILFLLSHVKDVTVVVSALSAKDRAKIDIDLKEMN